MPNLGGPEFLIIFVLMAFSLLTPLVGVFALIDIAQRSEEQYEQAGQSRTTWLIVAVLSFFVPCVVVGAAYYLLAVRPKLPPRRIRPA